MQYGLIGEHLPHSFSPEIHRRIGDYPYELKELSPQEVGAFLQRREFKGINVTIPYKQTVIPYLDEMDEAAKAIGAVNTVVNRGGKLCGYNTDFGGLKALIERTGVSVAGKKVLIFGTGGTSNTAHAVLGALGAKTVLKASTSGKQGAVSYREALTEHADAEILVNTTPCGMFPKLEGMAADPADFPRAKAVIDVVYNPLRTDLLQRAASLGIPCCGGLYMLVTQAILAAEHFFDTKIPAEKAESIYRQILTSKENIVLIGMPASGKTTVGTLLSKSLSRPFYDSDLLAAEKAGRSIPEIFRTDGEAAFRALETEVLADCAGKTGAVIATGGGAVLNPENIRYLKKNGRVYFLDRPVEALIPTADRPTASSREAIFRRYEERYPLYHQSCDKKIDASGSAEEVLEAVKEDFFHENFSA